MDIKLKHKFCKPLIQIDEKLYHNNIENLSSFSFTWATDCATELIIYNTTNIY